jgi:predicted homoserine dehydrogenase-like protein
MDYYQNPLGVVPYVPKHQNNHMVCGMADGTKQSIEMAVLGNAKGYYPLKRGMYGPTTTKQQLIKTFDELVDLSSLQGSYVDFVFGINGVDQGGGVFVIAYRDTPHIQEDMQYLKKGEGPFYLFFRDHHLCYFEAVSSIAEAVLFNTSTFYPKTWLIDVIAVAKRDLSPGIKLDGLGGYDCFGIVERADRAAQEKALPVGLAEFATVTKSLKKGEPITYDSVELEDALAVKLRKEQESRVAAQKRKERCLKEAVNL